MVGAHFECCPFVANVEFKLLIFERELRLATACVLKAGPGADLLNCHITSGGSLASDDQ
jgi:hypothetical protein